MEIMGHNRKRSRLLLAVQVVMLLFFAGCLFPFLGHAATLEGNAVPISTANDDQQSPQILALSDHGLWFVVWEDWRNWDISGADIYGQFVYVDDATNTTEKCGSEILLSRDPSDPTKGAPGNQTASTAAYRDGTLYSGDDKILIVWQDTRGDGDSGFVYFVDIIVTGTAFPSCPNYILGSESEITYTPVNIDKLLSRKLPKATYDTVNDTFWVSWVESRDTLQRVSEVCFGLQEVSYLFGDSSFPAYVQFDAATLEEASPPELIRNGDTRTNRLISTSRTSLVEEYLYEYFTSLNNITVANDTTSPETLFAWEGVSLTGTLTCTCTDADENKSCDPGEPIASSFSSVPNHDGAVHIYGLYEKQISQPSTYSTRFDNSTGSTYYPTLGFDSVHRKFLAAWEDLRDGQETKVYGQLLYSGGGLYNSNFIISYSDTDGDGMIDEQVKESKQTRPNIAYDGTNQRFFVTWQDGRNSQVSLENLDIYGQFVDSEGSLRGDNYPISIAEANQYNSATAYRQDKHEFLTVWKDARNFASTYSDIFGQRFTLGQPQLVFLNLDDTPLVPPLLDFGQLTVGQSAIQPIKLKNTGDTVVNIDCINPMPEEPFKFSALPTQLETCNGVYLSLIPSGEYTLSIKFEPVAGGTFIEQFAISSDANSPTVWLQGIGMGETPPNASITVSPQELNFDLNFDNEPEDTPVGETRSRNLTFINNGNIDITVSAVDMVPTDVFTIIGLGEGTVIPKGSSLITVVKFTPQQAMTYNAILDILYGPGVDPSRVYLAGTGTVNANMIVEPTSIDFGDIQIGEVTTRGITFTNDGNVDVTVEDINIAGDSSFTVTGIADGAVIPKDTTITATVTFAPVVGGGYSALLTVNYNLGLTATEINMSGEGFNLPSIGISPESIVFADTKVGETAMVNLSFANISEADVSITSILLPGGAPFSIIGLTAGSIVEAQKTLTGVINFNPTKVGTFTDTIKVIFSGDEQTYEIPVSGSGIMEDVVNIEETNTANNTYELVIDTATTKDGWLYILTGHVPNTSSKIYAYLPGGEQELFAEGPNLEDDWNTLYYSADSQSVKYVSLGEMDLREQAGVLYVGSFVDASQTDFDFKECLVRMLAVVVHDFSGEWEVTDTYEGKDYVNPYHLITEDKDGKIRAEWGPYDLDISYGDGSGYTITFTYQGYTYHYTITTLTDDTYEGTWYFSDGINDSPIYKTKGKKVFFTTVADDGRSSADAVLRQWAWGR